MLRAEFRKRRSAVEIGVIAGAGKEGGMETALVMAALMILPLALGLLMGHVVAASLQHRRMMRKRRQG